MRGCCPCFFLTQRNWKKDKKEEGLHSLNSSKRLGSAKKNDENKLDFNNADISTQTFNFRELATATKNFRQETLIGKGGFGRVYKGYLHSGQIVAVKKLDRNGLQGNEFLEEVMMLSRLHHQNLVNLIGHCADGEQRLLVYEYLPRGSLDDHLFDLKPGREPLDWFSRMKVAYGAAQGLEYLHTKQNPPVIYKDLKSSSILLDEEYNPKLSDFALKSTTLGTYGYSAPEHGQNRQHTVQSDVYSFGIVLLELITGRKAIDNAGPTDKQNLVTWAQPIFKDPRRFYELADPLLESNFPERGLNQVVAITAMCLQEESAARPMMPDIVAALSFLAIPPRQDARPSANFQSQKSSSSKKSSSQAPAEGVANVNGTVVTTTANKDNKSLSKSSSSSSSDEVSISSSNEDAKYDDDGKDSGAGNNSGKYSASFGLCEGTNSHSGAGNDSSKNSASFDPCESIKSERFYDGKRQCSSTSLDRSAAGNSEAQEEDGKSDRGWIEGISMRLGSMSIGYRTSSANSGFMDAILKKGDEDDSDKDQTGHHHNSANIGGSRSSSSNGDDHEFEISSESGKSSDNSDAEDDEGARR